MRLEQLAEQFAPLSLAEQKMLLSAERGEVADCGNGISVSFGDFAHTTKWQRHYDHPDKDDPSRGQKWSASRELRSELISWLCLDGEAQKRVHRLGLRVEAAKVVGQVDLSLAAIPFDLQFSRCHFSHGPKFNRTSVTNLSLSDSHVEGRIEGVGLLARGSINLDGVRTIGLRLNGAEITGSLNCMGAIIGQEDEEEENEYSFEGNRLIAGIVLLDSLNGFGEVRILRAHIGDLSAREAVLRSVRGYALNLRWTTIGGNVWMHGLRATGSLQIVDANIAGDLVCSKTVINIRRSRGALNLDHTKVGGDVYLDDGLTAEEIVTFRGARIEGTLHLNGASSIQKSDLEGLTYKLIDDHRHATTILEWLREQPVHPQPYNQLAKVLGEMGYEVEALDVLVEKEARKWRQNRQSWACSPANSTFIFLVRWPYPVSIAFWLISVTIALWDCLLRATIGYGYKPWRTLPWALGFVLVGWLVYAQTGAVSPVLGRMASVYEGSMVPTQLDAFQRAPFYYQRFSPLAYSVDSFVPVLNFHQREYWLPAAGRGCTVAGAHLAWCGTAVRIWTWVETTMGWLLTTLLGAALLGVVQRRE